MSSPDHSQRNRADPAGWSDSSARSVLQLMAESVAEMVGFEVTALSVVIDDELVTVAYVGPEEYREYLEQPDPAGVLDPVLADATHWGPRLRFLASDAHGELAGHWVTFEQNPAAEHPDAWHPEDVLLAVLSDDNAQTVGVISVDRPVSGRRPDARERGLLERYAAQAERAVLTAFEREELVHQIAHAEAARRLIRSASMPAHASLEAVLRSTHRPLVEGFQAAGSWIQVLDSHSPDSGYARKYDGEVVTLSDDVVELARELAPGLWRDQHALVITGQGDKLPGVVRRQLEELDLSSLLGVGLGAGTECLGFLALTRREQDPPWSQVEIDSALQIGHDLGAALMTAQALERERALVRELQQLDDYRSQLISTLSHELRTPLTVIAGNLEMLGGLDLETAAARHHAAMTRGSERMKKVVDDLLVLARVSNPQHPLVPVSVDLHDVAHDVVSLVESAAGAKGLNLLVQLEPTDLVVSGDPGELDRLLANLVSNAVKYTPEGGTVTVSARSRPDEVVLQVSDDGMGISEEDQVGLFGAFFRTTNPEALAQPGTGLGLAIVATIVERHEGSVNVSSQLGAGTTFTVTLPVTHSGQLPVGAGLTTPRNAAMA